MRRPAGDGERLHEGVAQPGGSGGTLASSSRTARIRCSSASMLSRGLLAAAGPARGHVGQRQLDQVVEIAPHLVIEAAHGRVGPAAAGRRWRAGGGRSGSGCAGAPRGRTAAGGRCCRTCARRPRRGGERSPARRAASPAWAPCRCRAAAPTSAPAASPATARTTCLVCSQTSLCRRPASWEKSTVASSSGSTTASAPASCSHCSPSPRCGRHDDSSSASRSLRRRQLGQLGGGLARRQRHSAGRTTALARHPAGDVENRLGPGAERRRAKQYRHDIADYRRTAIRQAHTSG